MLLEKVLDGRCREIDAIAAREKRATFYFCDLIKSDHENFSGAFFSTINERFKCNLGNMEDEIEAREIASVRQEFFEERLYFEVAEMFKGLSDESTRHFGLVTYESKMETPDVRLRFSEYFEYEGINCTGKRLTGKGVEEVNRYRGVVGLVSIEKARELSEKAVAHLL